MEETKKTWGGRRAGAGGPKKENPKIHTAFRLDADLKEYLSEKTNKSEFINLCIRGMKEKEERGC